MNSARQDRYWFRYHQHSDFRWYATLGQGCGKYHGPVAAFTEKRLRRKIARFIRKERLRDERRRSTQRESR